MAKRGLKLFGMGIGALAVIAGIIIGILFATGVLGKKNSSERQRDSESGTPAELCRGTIPSIIYFEKHPLDKYRAYLESEINEKCANSFDWSYNYNITTETPDGRRSRGGKQLFSPTFNQHSIDVDFSPIPPEVKSIEGIFWIERSNKGGFPDIKKSNEYPFKFSFN